MVVLLNMKKIKIITTFVILMVFTVLINTPVKAVDVLEDSQILCSDTFDNDFNGLTDSSDPSCAAFAPVAATSTASTTIPVLTGGSNTSGPSFGGGSSGSSFGSSITSGTPVSSVISTGAPISSISSSTEPICAEMINVYMKKGNKNNVYEVKKLQAFLNKHLNLNIPLTGFYGNITFNSVKAFQSKYKDTILTPWGITAPTGYFYKTTQRQVNLLLCSTAEIPMPILN